MDFHRLQKLMAEGSPAELEAGVTAVLPILEDLKATFADTKTAPETAQRIERVHKLQAQAADQKTVVGLVGSTGAGKSSVINALLDEEALLPGHTSVVTEVSYNNSDCPEEKYRAEVHFIGRDDWIKELRAMQHDMTSCADLSEAEHADNDSYPSIAYLKMRSVYPFLKDDELKSGDFNIPELMKHPTVSGALDAVYSLSGSTCKGLSAALQMFIGSESKTVNDNESRSPKYWPLVKVVRIFVQSPILKSGLTLVDLPGCPSPNVALSAIASQFIEQCPGLWHVVPIDQAVDDKMIHASRGDTFQQKRQFDGTYSKTTFICSKTDEISVEEMLKSMTEDQRAHQLQEDIRWHELRCEESCASIKDLNDRIDKLVQVSDQTFAESESTRATVRHSDMDIDVLKAPYKAARKRPSRGIATEACKRLKLQQYGNFKNEGSDGDNETIASAVEVETQHISKTAATQRPEETETRLPGMQSKKQDFERLLRLELKKLDAHQAMLKSLEAELERVCVQWRNESTRRLVKSQFAAGFQGMAQDHNNIDEDNSDPKQSHENLAEIATKLPVFCVSSKAYQKAARRFENEERIPAFRNLKDTEIPALQQHASAIVQGMRVADRRRLLADVIEFLNSLYSRVVLPDQSLKLANDLRRKELSFVAKATKDLKEELLLATQQAFAQHREDVDQVFSNSFESAIRVASDAASSMVDSLFCHTDGKGSRYPTIRAMCQGHGVSRGKNGYLNFDADLIEPMTQHLDHVLDLVREFPGHLLAETLRKVLQRWLKMDERPQLKKAASVESATRQVEIMENEITGNARIKTIVDEARKRARQLPVDLVAQAMAPVYNTCRADSGLGCFERAEECFRLQVSELRGTVFRQITCEIRSALAGTLDDLEKQTKAEIDNFVARFAKTYYGLLADQSMPVPFTTDRARILQLLSEVDQRLEPVMRPTAENPGETTALPLPESIRTGATSAQDTVTERGLPLATSTGVGVSGTSGDDGGLSIKKKQAYVVITSDDDDDEAMELLHTCYDAHF